MQPQRYPTISAMTRKGATRWVIAERGFGSVRSGVKARVGVGIRARVRVKARVGDRPPRSLKPTVRRVLTLTVTLIPLALIRTLAPAQP